MRLYNEIIKRNIKIGKGEIFGEARYTILPGGGGYFQGVKGIEEFTNNRIVIRFRKNILEVNGNNLYIQKYCDGDLEILGEIISVMRGVKG